MLRVPIFGWTNRRTFETLQEQPLLRVHSLAGVEDLAFVCGNTAGTSLDVSRRESTRTALVRAFYLQNSDLPRFLGLFATASSL